MRRVNVQEARTHLSRLLAEVERGEPIAITRAGRVIARLVPAQGEHRVLGADQGRMWIADVFDAPLPDELLRAFEGEVA
jgi:prevent-host-death family protein